jgi:hypothetical protein
MDPYRSFEKSKVIAHLFEHGIRRNNGVRITDRFADVLRFSERTRYRGLTIPCVRPEALAPEGV